MLRCTTQHFRIWAVAKKNSFFNVCTKLLSRYRSLHSYALETKQAKQNCLKLHTNWGANKICTSNEDCFFLSSVKKRTPFKKFLKMNMAKTLTICTPPNPDSWSNKKKYIYISVTIVAVFLLSAVRKYPPSKKASAEILFPLNRSCQGTKSNCVALS